MMNDYASYREKVERREFESEYKVESMENEVGLFEYREREEPKKEGGCVGSEGSQKQKVLSF